MVDVRFGSPSLVIYDWRMGKFRRTIQTPRGHPTVAIDPVTGCIYVVTLFKTI